MIAPMCAYTCRHDRAYVLTHEGMMETLCVYRRGHDRAFVCIHAWACSRLCEHIRVGITALMRAYTCGIHAWA